MSSNVFFDNPRGLTSHFKNISSPDRYSKGSPSKKSSPKKSPSPKKY